MLNHPASKIFGTESLSGTETLTTLELQSLQGRHHPLTVELLYATQPVPSLSSLPKLVASYVLVNGARQRARS